MVVTPMVMLVEIQVLCYYILAHVAAAMLSDWTLCGCGSLTGLRGQVARAFKGATEDAAEACEQDSPLLSKTVQRAMAFSPWLVLLSGLFGILHICLHCLSHLPSEACVPITPTSSLPACMIGL